MTLATQEIGCAWRALGDGSAIDELRASWGRLTAIRRELDQAVVALAHRIEQLRTETADTAAQFNAEDVVVSVDFDPPED